MLNWMEKDFETVCNILSSRVELDIMYKHRDLLLRNRGYCLDLFPLKTHPDKISRLVTYEDYIDVFDEYISTNSPVRCY